MNKVMFPDRIEGLAVCLLSDKFSTRYETISYIYGYIFISTFGSQHASLFCAKLYFGVGMIRQLSPSSGYVPLKSLYFVNSFIRS